MALHPRTTARYPAGALRPGGATQADIDALQADLDAERLQRNLVDTELQGLIVTVAEDLEDEVERATAAEDELRDQIVGIDPNAYQGLWNAATNTPPIPAADAENNGRYYIVAVAGTTNIDGTSTWELDDRIVSNGTIWQRRLAMLPYQIGALELSSADATSGLIAIDGAGAWDFEKTASGVTISHPAGDPNLPTFHIDPANRSTVSLRNLIIADSDDPGDFGQRTRFVRDISTSGIPITNNWHQQWGPTPSGTPSYNIVRKTIRPHHLSSGPAYTVNYLTNVSGYATGKNYHFLFDGAASGVAPTVNLNGWGVVALKRAGGAVPADNFWNAGVEATFVYNGTEMRADTVSNSDRPQGREDNRSLQGPFTARTYRDSVLMVAEPDYVNRGTGAHTIMVTRHNEAVERPVTWNHNLGWSVDGGWGAYESGKDIYAEYWNRSYPHQLVPETMNGALANQYGGDFWITAFAPGPENPTKTFGIAQRTIVAPDAARGVNALYVGKPGGLDTGLGIAFDHVSNTYSLVSTRRGTTGVTISGGSVGGEGSLNTAGWMLVTTATPHGLSEMDLVFCSGTTGGAIDGVWTTIRVNATQFIACGCRAQPLAASGSMFRVTRTTSLAINPTTGIPLLKTPKFTAVATAAADVTGDGTEYTVTGYTESHDTHAAFSGGIFAAPVTGYYSLDAAVTVEGLTAGHTRFYMNVSTDQQEYRCDFGDLAPDGNGRAGGTLSVMAFMDAGNTARVKVLVAGGAKVCDIAAAGYTWFCGHLVGD